MKKIIENAKLLYKNKVASGDERDIFALIKSLAPACYDVKADALGNITLKKGGKNGKYTVFSTHLDTAGFTATYVDGRTVKISPSQEMKISTSAFLPVKLSRGARGLLSAKKSDEIKKDDLFVEVFEGKAKAGEGGVVDTPLLKAGRRAYFGYGAATAFLISALLSAAEEIKETESEVLFLFTAQRQEGCRGAVSALYNESVEKAVVFDAVSGDKNGLVVKVKDKRAISDKIVLGELENALKEEGIAYKKEVFSEGEGEMNAFLSRGISTAEVDISVKSLCSSVECVSLEDAVNIKRLIKSYIK